MCSTLGLVFARKHRDVIQKVRILDISPEIPNDTLSFGPDFPEELRTQIADALTAFAETDAWGESIGNQDFYGWTGIDTASDAEYDNVRLMIEASGMTMEDLGRVEDDKMIEMMKMTFVHPFIISTISIVSIILSSL